RDWLKRLEALPTMVSQTTALMREGLKAGNTPPKVLMQRVTAQIDAQIVDDPTASPFYKRFKTFSDSVPQAERTALQAQARKVIPDAVVPAYREFASFCGDD